MVDYRKHINVREIRILPEVEESVMRHSRLRYINSLMINLRVKYNKSEYEHEKTVNMLIKVAFDCDHETLVGIAHKVELNPPALVKLKQAVEMWEHYQSGKSMEQLAEWYGITRQAISLKFKQYGLPTRASNNKRIPLTNTMDQSNGAINNN